MYTIHDQISNQHVVVVIHILIKYVTCSAILGLLDKDDDLRASHELLNTERILYISQKGAEI